MSREDTYNYLDNLFDEFAQALTSNNHRKLTHILKLTDSIETKFLNTYHRKKKEGVYYTNKKISEFMFHQCLLLFLNNQWKNISLTNIESIYDLDVSSNEEIAKVLLNLTICDPACGSGIFLLSAAHTLFTLLKKLIPDASENEIYLQILKNLYGYDINGYAIKLCCLKLFQWTFSEDDTDYNRIFTTLQKNLKIENRIISNNNVKYDIILGNPPYGNILNEDEKHFLKQKGLFYKDIYCTFLSKAIDWSRGIIGFLVPKSFLLRQGYTKFRNSFLSKVNIKKIFDIGPNLFKLATNEVQIILYEKKENYNEDLFIFDFPYHEIIRYHDQKVDSLRICFNSECPLCEKIKKIYVYTFKKICPYCNSNTVELNRIRIKPTPEVLHLIQKIESIGNLNYLNIKDFPKMIRGEEDRGLKAVKKILNKDTTGTCIFVNAKDDFSYYYIQKTKSFNIEEIDPFILKGNHYEYYLAPKLLIKHNSIIPQTCYSESPICFTSSIYSLLHKEISELKFLNALLNSVLIQFYCIYGINNQKDTTINLNQYMIRHLPIVKPNHQIKSEIVKKTQNIINSIETSHGNLDKDIINTLQQIDNIFFKLYNFTDSEKKIVISYVKDNIDHFNVIYA